MTAPGHVLDFPCSTKLRRFNRLDNILATGDAGNSRLVVQPWPFNRKTKRDIFIEQNTKSSTIFYFTKSLYGQNLHGLVTHSGHPSLCRNCIFNATKFMEILGLRLATSSSQLDPRLKCASDLRVTAVTLHQITV